LSAARLLNNPGAHRSVGQGRPADCPRVPITNCQDLVKRNYCTYITLEPLNHDLVARGHPVLLSARLHDSKHSWIRIPPNSGYWITRTQSAHSSPRRSRPSGEIICGFQGGSHTTSTLASLIPGIDKSF